MLRCNAKRFLASFVALALILSLSGCADPYTESMRTSAKFADSVGEGQKLVGELYADGTLDKAEKDDIVNYLIDATKANTKFRETAVSIHTTNAQAGKADYLKAADIVVAQAGDVSTLQIFHVKNPKAQARIQVWTVSFKAAVDAITLAIAKAKGK